MYATALYNVALIEYVIRCFDIHVIPLVHYLCAIRETVTERDLLRSNYGIEWSLL